MNELIRHAETLNFKVTHFSNPSCNGIIIGNSGLHFLNENEGWTWHYQPEGNSGPTVGKDTKYSAIFMAAFGEFIDYWHNVSFPNGNKPDEVSSLTNPRMANFITKEFTVGLIPTFGNLYNVTFDLSVIDKNGILRKKFTTAQTWCVKQKYCMVT